MAGNIRVWSAGRNAYRIFSGDCSWNPKLREGDLVGFRSELDVATVEL